MCMTEPASISEARDLRVWGFGERGLAVLVSGIRGEQGGGRKRRSGERGRKGEGEGEGEKLKDR